MARIIPRFLTSLCCWLATAFGVNFLNLYLLANTPLASPLATSPLCAQAHPDLKPCALLGPPEKVCYRDKIISWRLFEDKWRNQSRKLKRQRMPLFLRKHNLPRVPKYDLIIFIKHFLY